MTTAQSITAYFEDVATRHPAILHDPDPDLDYKQRQFFEMEWDQMMQNAAALALPKWTLVLEDYTEHPRDNGGDYTPLVLSIPFYIVKHVPQGRKDLVMAAWQAAREIAYDIIGKMRDDEGIRGCEPDVPAGVDTPKEVDLNRATIMRVRAPFADHAYGVRVVVQWRMDKGITIDRTRVAWVARS